jgi:hypothetical protein
MELAAPRPRGRLTHGLHRRVTHPLLVGTAEVLADAVRYVAIMLFVLLLLRQLARVAL